MKNKKGKKAIKYGNVNIPAECFDPKNAKFRISMMVRGDILDHFRARAEKEGVGYQVLMQQALSEAMNHGVQDRLSRIEEKIFGKGA